MDRHEQRTSFLRHALIGASYGELHDEAVDARRCRTAIFEPDDVPVSDSCRERCLPDTPTHSVYVASEATTQYLGHIPMYEGEGTSKFKTYEPAAAQLMFKAVY